MEALLNPETFEFFAKYILAGFVFLSARASLVSGEKPRPNETILESVILSLLNHLVWRFGTSWIFGAFSVWPTEVILVIEVVVQPYLLGLCVGWAVQADKLPAGLRRMVMPFLRPANDSFDLGLEQIQRRAFVIVTYIDGHVVYGLFGRRSLSSKDQDRGGLYLERLFQVGNDGNWIDAHPPRSGWISMVNVRSVEFLETGGTHDQGNL